MTHITALPASLIDSYNQWHAGLFKEREQHYKDLAEHGQSPASMVISCCDSRVQATEIFGAMAGDMFVHRNVANLVPPYAPSGDHHGTSAAVEYAIRALKVKHLIVLGHSQCGGVQACHDICASDDGAAHDDFIFVKQWLEILHPAYGRIDTTQAAQDQVVALGHQGIIGSLENLLGFPFVGDAVADGSLSLHGAWHDIGSGKLHHFDPDQDGFVTL